MSWHHIQPSSSSSRPPLRSPGLRLRCRPPFLLAPLEPVEDLPGGGRTKAKSTLMVCSRSFSPLQPSMAAFASETVGNSIRA